MSLIVYADKEKQMTSEKLEGILNAFQRQLSGKVEAVYIFGSASTGQMHDESDIDLIVIEKDPSENFVERPLKYQELFRIWPKIDLLVYSPSEFESLLKDSESGFWFSVKDDLKKII